MSNNSNLNNNAISEEMVAQFRTFMAQSGLTLEQMRALAKEQAKSKFVYVEGSTKIATCNACGNEFDTTNLPDSVADTCRKSGICPDCAAKLAAASAVTAVLKAKKISSKSGGKVIVNGGKGVGQRLKAAIRDAIESPNFNSEILANFCDLTWSHSNFKFSAWPILIDVTGLGKEDQKDLCGNRFYADIISIGDAQYRICSQIYDAQFSAGIATLKQLGLIDKDY